ncbi:MAG: hypothetical protein WD069_10545 [Planctomycetales bacterium]
MSTEQAPASPSPLARFFDAFFREQNIKWMLGVGMLILVGSSLMLVSTHWERMAPVAQYLVFLGYAAGIYGAGELCLHRLGLTRTGAGLQMLTVLLLPITFAALQWIATAPGSGVAGWFHGGAFLALLGVDLAFASFAARRIFRHLLRGSQPTFLAGYLVLCVAGAVLPAAAADGAPAASGLAGMAGLRGTLMAAAISAALWLAFAAGTIKVNRHVFHLMEEHRWPRVFGFFPIALLGSQLIVLYALKLAPQLPLEWSGLAAVLVAIPVLLAADAAAAVFRQRTGDLVRPWPWHMLLPLGVGLALCAAGLVLSATGFPRSQALVPTAALVAAVMAGTAQRTGKPAFAWGTLVCVMLAYNFSPVFFADLARQAVRQGAAAVHEPKLPYAFYGLTYLPLLAACALAYRPVARRLGDLFAVPLRRFSVGLAGLLLVVSWTHLLGSPSGHPKAVFPVGLAMVAVFAAQTFLFRDRRLLLPACAALCAASLGLPVFVEQVLEAPVPPGFAFASAIAAAAILTWPGKMVDIVVSRRIPPRAGGGVDELEPACGTLAGFATCQTVGLAWTLVVVGASLWPGAMAWGFPLSWGFGLVATALLFAHACDRSVPGVAEAALAYPLIHLLAQGTAAGVGWTMLLSAGTLALAALWLMRHVLAARPQMPAARIFAAPAARVSAFGLSLVLALYALPACVAHTLSPQVAIAWSAVAAAVIWSFDAARTFRAAAFGYLGCLGVLGLASALTVQFGGTPWAWERLPIVWAAVALGGLPIVVALRRRFERLPAGAQPSGCADKPKLELQRAVLVPIERCSAMALAIVAFGTLVFLTGPMRIAGALAVTGLVARFAISRDERLRQLAAVAAHWQLLALAAQGMFPGVRMVGDVRLSEIAAAALPLALLSAAGTLAVEWRFHRIERSAERLIVDMHLFAGRIVLGMLLAASLMLLPTGLTALETGCALATFVLIVADLLLKACRRRNAELVWLAEAVAAAGIAYFIAFGLIPLDRGWSLYGLLGAAGVLWAAAEASKRHEATAVLAEPFERTAVVLPGLAVIAGVMRHFLFAPVWIGMNSLALLLAAGFYFHHGWERQKAGLVTLSAAILNVALALLWRELEWTDPQFFMVPLGLSILLLVELLRTHIPAPSIPPLRYLGAIVILVSPTFHIVEGSWLHLGTLMVAAVAITLLAIGLRAKPLMYTGTGFLVADLAAMVVRGTIDRPQLLWFVGIAVGLAVIALAAWCEKHREDVLQRLRLIAAELQRWE